MLLNGEDLERFRALEEALWRESPEQRDGLLADDFKEFCRFGDIYDRDHLLQPSDGRVRVDFPFDAFEAVALAEDVVLVTYENTVHRNGSAERARRSSIWVRRHGDWRLRFMQATTLS